ncbi:MAG: zinc ribbon domain-containing protein [Chloroflexi bacterium]|nr:zinc ribbon domain-containing protein [Chloroflexota bacterium]
MPIYEYQCDSCSSQFELTRSFHDNSPVCCPQCGGSTKRIFSPVAVIFKGPGFYCTDHKQSHSLPHRNGDKEKEKTPSAKAESKGEGHDHEDVTKK